MKITKININGTMDDIDVSFTKKTIIKVLEKKSSFKDITELYKWTHDNKVVSCYGWYEGEPGFENKHDLIPNGSSSFCDEESSEKLLFGALFMVCYDKKLDEYVDFCVSDYGAFYELMFEGFDDCENSEEESGEEEPNTDDDEFIDDDIDEDTPYYEYGSDDELDEDENDYSDGSC